MSRVFAFFRRPPWLCLAALILQSNITVLRAEILPSGNRPLAPSVHALVGGTVVVKPGEQIEGGIVVIHDGRIERVGKDAAIPAEARVWDVSGLTVYAGSIDPHLTFGAASSAASPDRKGLDLTSGRFFGVPGNELDPGNSGPGASINTVTPERRVADSFAPDTKLLEKMRELGFTAANVVPERGIFRGSSAFVTLGNRNPNETILKADVFQHVAFSSEGGRDDGYPSSLMGIVATVRQTFFDVGHYGLDHADYAKNSSRKQPAYNPALAALQPVTQKQQRVVVEPGSARMVERAARVAREAGVEFVMLASGQEWRRPDLAKAAGAPFIVALDFPEVSKMPEEDDWEQLTLDQLRAWDWAPENAALLRQQGIDVALTTSGLADKKNFRRNLRGAIQRGLSEQDALAAVTTVPAALCGVAHLTGTIEPGKLANLTLVDGNYFDGEAKVRSVWIEGIHHLIAAKADAKAAESKKEGDKEKKEGEKNELQQRVAQPPLKGRGPFAVPAEVWVTNATVWTSSPKGILKNASVHFANGKIKSVGNDGKPSASTNAVVIDGTGLHVTPGLIDCHSHSMILGSVNESTLPSSAMVRIGDVVNSETGNIYEQLAGGLTVANLLHGSANPIGGQNQVIKLRDGASPEELKFEGAPEGIKFALGENVKQANWGEKYTTRFPQTRMGVRTFIANRFYAAQQYLDVMEKYKQSGGVPPRRDLELEAIGEILRGERWIHCHSYRQDEILEFLRLMETFNVQVGTLQHVLEGYKVADEIARHGAGASCFADWWAYKFEVFDAIPHAGSLMHDRGVLVSFNSDSSDLARRMNFEAAKAVKFGGVKEEAAVNFVTINPAKQLRIDHRVGSLEPGKDADFALWSGHPLDSTSVCLQTWIEGKKYFDRSLSEERATALEAERRALVAKAKRVLKVVGGGEGDAAGKNKFLQHSLEHAHGHCVRHCEDDVETH